MNCCDIPSECDEARILAYLPTRPLRDQLLVIAGMNTGLRLRELLGLSVDQVWRDGSPVSVLQVSRRNLKGGRGPHARAVRSRKVPLNAAVQEALAAYIAERLGQGLACPALPLFLGRGIKPLCRQQGARIVRAIFEGAGLDPDRVWGAHSLRKRFCRRLYDSTHDLNLVRAAVGHRWITTTQLYLGPAEDEAAAAIMALGNKPQQAAASGINTAAFVQEPKCVGL